ncbi:MAG: ATP-binding protein [Actinobacteria bacterium]|nr:ATP-binding protein [Actinomycetota bacterium]MBW3650199.1 ATP-binding protein [Actinomycetota bacterium]
MNNTLLEVERAFEPDEPNARAARRFIADTVAAIGLPSEDALVLGNELVTNVVLHARTEFVVSMALTEDSIRVGVTDQNSRLPIRVNAPLDATSGRGLSIVAALAQRWGVDAHPGGKTVWFELSCQGEKLRAAGFA